MPRWNWTWEETPRTEDPRAPLGSEPDGAVKGDAAPSEQPPAGGAGGGGTVRPTVGDPVGPNFQRRRVGAAIGIVALLVVIIALIASSGGGGTSAHARALAAAKAKVSAAAKGKPASSEPTPQAEEAAINRVLAYTPAVTSGGNHGNEVALTFDDGPGPYTTRLVATLNRLHVHATFFAIGEMERYFSEGTRDELRSGDAVGDHTETHPMLATMSASEQHEEILDQMLHIEVLGGPRPRLFRPPYGSYNATTWRELGALHLLTVLWSTDTSDYRLPGVNAIVHSALAGAHPGAIILMHDGGGDRSETIAALPAIIKGLRNRHLRPVTIPQLMLDDPPPHGQPIPENLAGD